MSPRKLAPLLLFLLSISTYARPADRQQSVAVVLSGGGAKGVAHVGVLKVLEENNIPIDYICGTSIGAIVGGLYTMGWSPEKILNFMKDDDFMTWLTGIIEPNDQYLFRKFERDPNLLSVYFDEKVNISFASSILPPTGLNLKMLQFTAQASELCKRDFDSLMVPYFSMGADVNNEEPLVFDTGRVGTAIRASMSIPLVFSPVKVGDRLIVDGGVQNNFPVDVAKEKFNPDVIIGSQVVTGNVKAREGDVISQIMALIMRNANFTIPDSVGVLIKSDLQGLSVLAFEESANTYKIGYQNALDSLPRIKRLVHDRVDTSVVSAKRAAFEARKKPFVFGGIRVVHPNPEVQEYIASVFNPTDSMDFATIEKKYYKLLEDEMVKTVVIRSDYDYEAQHFVLEIEPDMNDDGYTSIGHNISSNDVHQFYLAFGRNIFFSNTPILTNAAFSVGTFTSYAEAKARVYYNLGVPFYSQLALQTMDNEFNRNGGDMIYHLQPENMAISSQGGEAMLGFPFSRQSVLRFEYSLSRMKAKYLQDRTRDARDNSIFNQQRATLRLYANNLDNTLFPKYGSFFDLYASYKSANESFTEANKKQSKNLPSNQWIELGVVLKHFTKQSNNFYSGLSFETRLSNKPDFITYHSNLALNPQFRPDNYSHSILNSSFNSQAYTSFGYHGIWRLGSTSLRNSSYLYLPLYVPQKVLNKEFDYYTVKQENIFSKQYLYNMTSLIQETLVGPISFELATTYTDKFDFHFIFNFGFRIFKNPIFSK